MGAWGYGVFDDDSSYDVMEELKAEEDIVAYLEKAFEDAIFANSSIYKGGTMSEPVCVGFDERIAASVCGAVLDSILYGTAHRFDGFIGRDGDGSEQYLSWIAGLKNIHCEHLKSKAVKALKRLIAEDSELSELWGETEDYSEWKNIYMQMIERLVRGGNS